MTYCMLTNTTDWTAIMLIVQVLPMAFMALGALIGFMSGINKISTSGLAWMLAVGLYTILLGIFKGALGQDQPAIPIILSMCSCAIAGILFHSLSKRILEKEEKEVTHSDIRKVLEKEEKFRRIEEEEFKELRRDRDADEDDFERLERRQRRRRRRYLEKMKEKTSLISRLIAAAVCGVVSVFVVGIILDISVFVIAESPLATGRLAGLCEHPRFQETLSRADKVSFDHLLIGLFMIAVKIGYKKGVLSTIHSLTSGVSSIVACALGFYIPFSALGAEGGALGFTSGFVGSVVGTVQPAIAGVVPIEIPDVVYQSIGKIAVGIVYTIVLLIVMSILTKLLLKSVELSYNNEFFHFFDGALGIIWGIVVFAVLLAAVLFVFLILRNLGYIPSTGNLFAGTQIFEIYNGVKNIGGGLVETIIKLLPLGK